MIIPYASLLLQKAADFVLCGAFSAPNGVSAPSVYPGHTVYKLNDGNLIPSPAFGVGSALYQKNATTNVLLALENGYRHFDNAAIYDNEGSLGDAIRISGIPRQDLYLTTKYDAISNESVKVEFERSLQLLGVDYVDLYLIHFPQFAANGGGIGKVWAEFEALKEEGLVRSIGVSNYGVKELTELLLIAKTKPAVNQIRLHSYNALEQAPVIALGKANGIITEAYSALSPITKFPGGPADKVGARIADRIASVAGGINVTAAQAIFDWLKTKGVVAITTSGSDVRLKQALDVFGNGFPPLTKEEVKAYETAGPGWDKKA